MLGSYARARAQTYARTACQVGGAPRARTADGRACTGKRKDARPPHSHPFAPPEQVVWMRAERQQRERVSADVAHYSIAIVKGREHLSGSFLTLHLLAQRLSSSPFSRSQLVTETTMRRSVEGCGLNRAFGLTCGIPCSA